MSRNSPKKIQRLIARTSRHYKNRKAIKEMLKHADLKDTEIVAYSVRNERHIVHDEARKSRNVKAKAHSQRIVTQEFESVLEGYWYFAALDDSLLNNINRALLSSFPVWLSLNNGYTFKLAHTWEGGSDLFFIRADNLLNLPTQKIIHYDYPKAGLQTAIDLVQKHAEANHNELFLWMHGLTPKRAVSFLVKLRGKTEQSFAKLRTYIILDETPSLYAIDEQTKQVWDTVVDNTYYRVMFPGDIVQYEKYTKETGKLEVLNKSGIVSQALTKLLEAGAIQLIDAKLRQNNELKRYRISANRN